MPHSTQKRPFRRTFRKSISQLPTEKTKPNKTKNAFINQKKCTTIKKLKPGLVAFYDVRPGNGVERTRYIREEISKEKVKK